jgi:ribose 5-phosphate isomerase B
MKANPAKTLKPVSLSFNGRRPKITIGSDHAGYLIRRDTIAWLKAEGFEIIDHGTDSPASVDYPVYGKAVAGSIAKNDADLGILYCGTGIGIGIAANRSAKVRAAVCWDEATAQASRAVFRSNVLSMGVRAPMGIDSFGRAKEILTAWLSSRSQAREDENIFRRFDLSVEFLQARGKVPFLTNEMLKTAGVCITSDHAGCVHDLSVMSLLRRTAVNTKADCIGFSDTAADEYIMPAENMIKFMDIRGSQIGISVSATGNEMAVLFNKVKGVRAAVCRNTESAILARQHNNANILCLPCSLIHWEAMSNIIKAFMATEFEGEKETGQRHKARVEMLDTGLTG